MQEKINTFFSEKVIVPSPLNQFQEAQPLIADVNSPENREKHTCDGKVFEFLRRFLKIDVKFAVRELRVFLFALLVIM